jgi:hypothetical protein
MDGNASVASNVTPALPRGYVDTAAVRPSGRTLSVTAEGDLQEAIDEANFGDEIVLQAGAQYKGPFRLRNKQHGSGWITIRSSSVGKDFPSQETRIHPSHAEKMATLTSNRYSVVLAEEGAHHYRFIGVEIKPAEQVFLRNVVQLGDNSERSAEDLPHHIILDRCLIHGDPKNGSRRGVAMNGRHIALINSYVFDFKEVGVDTQAVGGWSGVGPFKIMNNYLEAAGENILFGGADPIIPNLVPSDIEIRHNHLAKPLSWKRGEPQYDGSNWQVKILLELKNARRVLIDGNIIEWNWQTPGYGFAIVFTVRNQDGGAPWSVIEDVTFTNNIVRHSASGVNILGFDDMHPPSGQAKRILIKNNIFDDINGPRWGGKGRLFQLIRGTKDVVIEHNTGFQTGHILAAGGDPQEGFVYRYNITPHNEYGMEGEGTGVGRPTFERHLPDSVVTHNIMIAGDFYAERYPATNEFPESVQSVPFLNASGGDYRLGATSALKGFRGAETPGVDSKALCAALGDIGLREPICSMSLSDEPTTSRVGGRR